MYKSSQMTNIAEGLKRWLGMTHGHGVTEAIVEGHCGLQDDMNSCGVCVINVMDHAMCGADLFIHQRRFEWRMEYFATLIAFTLEKVSFPNISLVSKAD
jgi:hypothetical protein